MTGLNVCPHTHIYFLCIHWIPPLHTLKIIYEYDLRHVAPHTFFAKMYVTTSYISWKFEVQAVQHIINKFYHWDQKLSNESSSVFWRYLWEISCGNQSINQYIYIYIHGFKNCDDHQSDDYHHVCFVFVCVFCVFVCFVFLCVFCVFVCFCVLCDFMCFCVILCDFVWFCMILCDFVWFCMILCDFV